MEIANDVNGSDRNSRYFGNLWPIPIGHSNSLFENLNHEVHEEHEEDEEEQIQKIKEARKQIVNKTKKHIETIFLSFLRVLRVLRGKIRSGVGIKAALTLLSQSPGGNRQNPVYR